ncbi:hypothetical protein BSL82_01300 [Tardibacter chloracetimidivorans]|uniref:Uncharacterized protein n=1 Tax=Tardibacter chloracetimidivorans TaxID=1921510 RepID=A0A1L3ZR63_9SPHN|nr:hypothetical protein [Tardibacter chloracetimidivorans]API58100.1 hypothetical protein BSL82_01300 [Tardibacter chloracetimidivorans]
MPRRLADAPALPDGLEALWEDFAELSASRGSTGMGPMRITYLDIDAYMRVTRRRFDPWELEAIRRADHAFLADWGARVKRD